MEPADLALLRSFEERVTTVEEISANLFQGYLELATIVESLVTQMLKPLEPDAAKEFTDEMTQHRRAMMEMVRGVAHDLGGTTPDDAPTMEPVADEL